MGSRRFGPGLPSEPHIWMTRIKGYAVKMVIEAANASRVAVDFYSILASLRAHFGFCIPNLKIKQPYIISSSLP